MGNIVAELDADELGGALEQFRTERCHHKLGGVLKQRFRACVASLMRIDIECLATYVHTFLALIHSATFALCALSIAASTSSKR